MDKVLGIRIFMPWEASQTSQFIHLSLHTNTLIFQFQEKVMPCVLGAIE